MLLPGPREEAEPQSTTKPPTLPILLLFLMFSTLLRIHRLKYPPTLRIAGLTMQTVNDGPTRERHMLTR